MVAKNPTVFKRKFSLFHISVSPKNLRLSCSKKAQTWMLLKSDLEIKLLIKSLTGGIILPKKVIQGAVLHNL